MSRGSEEVRARFLATLDPERFAADILAAGDSIWMFRHAYRRLLQSARERFGVTEQGLESYLQPPTAAK